MQVVLTQMQAAFHWLLAPVEPINYLLEIWRGADDPTSIILGDTELLDKRKGAEQNQNYPIEMHINYPKN